MHRTIILTLLLALIISDIVSCDLLANDFHALNTIFKEEHLCDNAFTIHRQAVTMPAEDRYQFLSDWVLPNADHDTIRMGVGFTPLHPAPPVQSVNPDDLKRLRVAEQTGQSRIQLGGQLVAPAIDLVEVATALGRLDEVRTKVDRFTPTSEQQQRCQLAMRIQLDCEQKDLESARQELLQLFEVVKSGTHSSIYERCPETVAAWVAVRHQETLELAQAMLYQIIQSQIRRNVSSGERAWEVHLQALWGRTYGVDQTSIDERSLTMRKPFPLEQWTGAQRVMEVTRGSGRPPALWQVDGWRVDNLAIHCDDYLFFQSPLRGNFEVECDITLFNWRDSTIFVAGNWIDLDYGLTGYKLGNVRGASTRQLSSKLVKPRGWYRSRTVVRDNVYSTYINGHPIHQEELPAEHDPWVAIRNVLRNFGRTRGLRITGNPVIPESINISAEQDLPGWMPYYREAVRENGSWRHERDWSGKGGIVGVAQPRYAGTWKESLLYYVRPMLEDGEIEYDFYYQAGKSHTHPALDRLAFMLDPDGVRIHWITDGAEDRTGLDPLNLTVEPANRRGPDKLPLKDDDWNHLKLALVGNTVHLFLNGQEIYERELEVTNQRTFGLFYFADRTECRVQNIVWRGNWPRTLPEVKEQELAGSATDKLDADLPKLTAVFEHDFAEGGLPDDRFSVYQQDMQDGVLAEQDGVHMIRPGQSGRYLHHHIWPRVTIKGDFDVTASFRNFEASAEAGSKETKCSLMLGARTNAPDQANGYILIRHVHKPNVDDDVHVQGAISRTVNGATPRTFLDALTFEADAGTLRLARRGNRLYFLIAEYDSPNFRLIDEVTFSVADVMSDGLRLTAVAYGPGETRVVWTNLAIQAEELVDESLPSP